MKKTMTVSTALGIGLLMLSPVASAQKPKRDAIAEHLFPPELIMSNQNAIGLDDKQKKAIRAEVQRAQTRFSEVQWRLHDAMEILASLLDQEPTDEAAVMEHLDEVLDAEREVKRMQLTLMIRIKNELNAEQRARLSELRAEKPRGRARE